MEKIFDDLISKLTLMHLLGAIGNKEGSDKAKDEAQDLLNDYIDKRIENYLKK